MFIVFFGFGVVFLSLFFTHIVLRIARRYGVLDVPDAKKKLHARATPLWGGIAPFCVFLLAFWGMQGFTGLFTSGSVSLVTLLGFSLSIFVLLLGGMWDDVVRLPPRISFLFPLIAALIATVSGVGVVHVTNPFGGVLVLPDFFAWGVSFFWLLGVTYTTKLLDGVDGLVTGLGLVGSAMIAALAFSPLWYQPDIAVLASLLFCALLGFFFWNAPPARIFLGEGGSTAIGFSLAALAIMGGSKFATLLLVLALPALDTAFVIYQRLRAGVSPFSGGDGRHLHTILQKRGWSSLRIVLFYVGIAFFCGIMTLFFSSFEKMIALGVLGVLCLFTLVLFSRSSSSSV